VKYVCIIKKSAYSVYCLEPSLGVISDTGKIKQSARMTVRMIKSDRESTKTTRRLDEKTFRDEFGF